MDISGALIEPGQPVIILKLNIQITVIQPQLDKKYIFATFRSIEEATTAINLDGIFYVKILIYDLEWKSTKNKKS